MEQGLTCGDRMDEERVRGGSTIGPIIKNERNCPMNSHCTDHEAAESRLSFEEMNLAEPILNALQKPGMKPRPLVSVGFDPKIIGGGGGKARTIGHDENTRPRRRNMGSFFGFPSIRSVWVRLANRLRSSPGVRFPFFPWTRKPWPGWKVARSR